MLYTLILYSAVCLLQLNKSGGWDEKKEEKCMNKWTESRRIKTEVFLVRKKTKSPVKALSGS